jgi:AcrR family transcriptional regulator
MAESPPTRTLILATAARLFASEGYAAVSMRDVAAETSMTPANLYHHFKDKETLIRESLVHVFSDRNASFEDLFAKAKTPDEKIETFVDWFVHLLFEDQVFSKLLYREILDGDAKRLEYLANTILARPFSMVTGAIAECVDGEDPVMLMVSIEGLVTGHFQMAGVIPHLPGGRSKHADPRVVSRHIMEMVRKILGLPSKRKR